MIERRNNLVSPSLLLLCRVDFVHVRLEARERRRREAELRGVGREARRRRQGR